MSLFFLFLGYERFIKPSLLVNAAWEGRIQEIHVKETKGLLNGLRPMSCKANFT
jgi:hypothetical protein